jgi:hypothetical protein
LSVRTAQTAYRPGQEVSVIVENRGGTAGSFPHSCYELERYERDAWVTAIHVSFTDDFLCTDGGTVVTCQVFCEESIEVVKPHASRTQRWPLLDTLRTGIYRLRVKGGKRLRRLVTNPFVVRP